MSGYLGLVTSEHRNRPRFMATVAAVTDPLCGLQELLETMRAAFDVDSAVGGQLDRTGEWIGRSRHLRLELDDVYFEWGREAVGWARGSWKGLYDPETGMVRLPDETYRLLLKAKIGANRWDGTVPGAYEVWESAFADTGSLILMQDNQDMSVVIGLAGTPLDAVMRNLLLQGYLPLKPEGVRVAWYAVAPERGPLLGWNCETGGLSGWGKGIWPVGWSRCRRCGFIRAAIIERGGGRKGPPCPLFVRRAGSREEQGAQRRNCSSRKRRHGRAWWAEEGVHHAHIRYQ
ncbi:MAG: DUF2612 domain-containing protein [Bilophila wadsworthia]